MADLAIIIEQVARGKSGFIMGDTSAGGGSDAVRTDKTTEKPLQLAILGRQNVGKSTLVNALLQKERVIAGPTPGLTRDAIAIEWSWNERKVQLVDTAGIRKISQRADSIEDLAVQDAMRAMKIADVAVLVLDAKTQYLTRQELVIADAVVKEGRALVLAANKMDLLVDDEYTAEQYTRAVQDQIYARIPMLRRTPVVAMSSLKGEGVNDLMPIVFDARDRWERKISTGILNRWLSEVLRDQPPPTYKGRPVKIKYIMQTKGRPPTFLLFCNTSELPSSYMRYLMRNFQDTFDLYGMEVRLAIKKSAEENPYSKSQTKRSGFGLGGKDAQKARLVHQLKTTGGKLKRRRRRTKQ
jgi:GTP-binding protein